MNKIHALFQVSFWLLLLPLSWKKVSGETLSEAFLGGSDPDQVGIFERYVETYYIDHGGGRRVSRARAKKWGERAFRCVSKIAKIKVAKVLPTIPFVRGIIYRSMYEAFRSEDDIEAICDGEEDGDDERFLTELAADNNSAGSHHLRQRSLQEPMQPSYPSETNNKYTGWANREVGKYLLDGASKRANPGTVVSKVHNRILILSAVDAGLTSSKSGMDIVCKVAGSFELGFDPGDACNVITESIDIPRGIVQSSIENLWEEQTTLDYHNALINSADLEAINENTLTLARGSPTPAPVPTS